MPISLYPHNQAAYTAALAMLSETGKAAIIHPTGTGKSFIAFKLCEDHPDKTICWLSPSEYIFRTQLENLKKATSNSGSQNLKETSAGTGSQNPGNTSASTEAQHHQGAFSGAEAQDHQKAFSENEAQSHQKTYSGSETLNTQEAFDVSEPENSEQSACGFEPRNIKFFTYAKLMLMDANEIADIRPDFIVLDEFHRCGAQQWGEGVHLLLSLYPNVPLLGLTATNIRYLDRQRDMADELFDSNIASRMTLGEAIVRGILTPPRYVLSVFSYQKDLERYRRRVRNAKGKASYQSAAKYYEAIRRKLENAEGLDEVFARHMTDKTGKYLVFCSNADHMDEMIAKVPEWFRKVDPHPEIYRAYADDPKTDKAFAAFKASESGHLKLLFCIDMLNEGVHLPDISGVILLRPTLSPIIYKQQIGRALAAGAGRDAVIFDIVLNIESLYSIGTIQEEMRAAITYYRYLGQYKNIVNETFDVIDETRDCKTLFAELERTLDASWDLMYAEAEAYYRAHGDLLIPAKYKTDTGLSLGNWLNVQRKIYSGKAEGFLSEDQIRRLEQLGIVWDSYRDLSWERSYLEAKAYFEANGNLLVPTKYVTPSGFPLGLWIMRMRAAETNARTGILTNDRIQKLNEIGMSWDALSDQWERNFKEAEDYYREHGNLLVPAKYVTPSGLKLGYWIAHLRRKRSEMLAEEEASREKVGTIAESQTFLGNSVGTFTEEHSFTENTVRTMEASRGINCGTLTDVQIARLNSIGMAWNADEERWQIGLAAAKAYREAHGNLSVPAAYEDKDGYRLGLWISLKRRQYKKGTLTPDQIAALETLGMRWEAHTDHWREMYDEAKAYYETHGNLRVPRAYRTANGHNLSLWLGRMKRDPEKLTTAQRQALSNIGMQWPTQPQLAAG